jgi:hypothetical protein
MTDQGVFVMWKANQPPQHMGDATTMDVTEGGALKVFDRTGALIVAASPKNWCTAWVDKNPGLAEQVAA